MITRNHVIALGLIALLSVIAIVVVVSNYARPGGPEPTAVAVSDSTVTTASTGVDPLRAATISYFQTQSAQQTQEAGGVQAGATVDPLTPIPTEFAQTVIVVANTDCRFGPGTFYGVVISLFVGEQALIRGVEPEGLWYFIETLGQVRCWVQSHVVSFVEVTGTGGGTVPVVTPPATPIATLTPTLFIPTPTSTLQNIGTPAP